MSLPELINVILLIEEKKNNHATSNPYITQATLL